jgi:amidase
MTELWKRSAQELAALIANKKASSVEIVDAHLARIEAVNPTVNAIVRVLSNEARAAAADADRKVASGEPLGPLHGVPCTVKENIDMAGLPTTWGVPALSGAVNAARCAGGGEDAAGRCNTDWPHEPTRHGAAHAYGQQPLRPHAESVEPQTHRRRIEWW